LAESVQVTFLCLQKYSNAFKTHLRSEDTRLELFDDLPPEAQQKTLDSL